jgi:energy-coupling factor transporter ATP-binding protein EcfA2
LPEVTPFVGLRPFEPQDVPLFFGRDEPLQRLVNRVRNQRLVILFGPSGSGKTSLIRAGLLPVLSASQQAPNVTLLARVVDDPFLGIARALVEANVRSTSEEQSLAATMRDTPESFSDCLRQAGYLPERTLVVLDQYEEALFLLSAIRRKNFEQTITRAADESGLRGLFVLRSDYLGPAISDGPLSELGPSSLVSLNPLTIDEARTIIVKPAERQGVAIEQEVVDAILDDLRHDLQPHLLQLVMHRLWNARRGDRITLADYTALGGVARLTSRIYDEPAVRSRWSLSRLASSVGLDALSRSLDERVRLLEQTRADFEKAETEFTSLVSRREALARKMNEILSEKKANAPNIFISYAREDEEQAKALYAQLHGLGFSPWIDQEDIPAGKEWAPEIEAAMHASDFVVLCLSNRSVSKRGFVQRELHAALDLYKEIPEGRVFLLPVRLEACPVPKQLATFQYTDLFETDGLDKLSRSILREWANQLRAKEEKSSV